jgi:hypothetical protein
MTRKLTWIGCVTAALVAGCGGHTAQRAAPPKPKLPHVLAAQLASLGDTVAQQLDAGDSCGALASATQLDSRARAAVAGGEVPAALRRPLTQATTRLTTSIQCVPVPASPPPHRKNGEHDHGKHKGHGGEGD